MISITLPSGEILKMQKGTRSLDVVKFIKDKFSAPVMEAIVNNVQTDLQYPLTQDCTLDFITLDSELGMRVYVNTLLFMYLTSAKRRYPHVKMEVRNTLGSALYIKFAEGKLSNEEVLNLQFSMKDLVQRKVPINLVTSTKEECMTMEIDPVCDDDRKSLINNAPEGTPVYMYELLGNKAFFFGKLAPNCGYCSKFELFPFDEGVIINYPSHHMWHDIENFEENKKIVHDVFQESNEWAHTLNCATIASFNKQIEQGFNNKMILVAEALHEKKIIAMADKIAAKKDKLKLVLIAGPSSSGKTSTCQRLSIHLAVNGLQAIPISMDDYYVEREKTPRKPDGGYDFECVEAIDLPLFNEQMEKLLAGESVRLPKFNFKTGKREWKDGEFKLKEGEILLVEGIHGLNDRLTANIPAENKIKVYVSALTPMSLDNYNRINTTDVRLMRRMVRDNQFRSHDALRTLLMWEDVRAGEEKYIFPFQPYADIVFNTTLIYELAVLKKYAEPLLKAVPIESGKAYMTAQRLLLLLSFVHQIDDSDIPNNSILREFVGGSVFRDAL
ncbi:MAG: TGS domain-containing protein [Phascolarctobacterium sp.]|nr:TGS domain-containing protein [Phascolarctobacterium sp.]